MTVLLVVSFVILAFYGMLTAWMGLNVILGAGKFKSPPAKETPTVTVLIPARNEAEKLPRLLAQLDGCGFEVIVINDHSEDATEAVAKRSGVTVLTNEGSGKKSALRTGLNQATRDVVVTLDADVILPENWSDHLLGALKRRHDADLWLFPVLIDRPKGLFQSFEALDVISLMGTAASFSHQHHAIMGSGACLAIRREAYNEAIDHLRDEIVSGDDVFLIHHLRRQKKNIVFIDARVTTVKVEPSTDLKSFLRQRIRWGQKSPYYNDFASQVVAILVFLVNLGVFFTQFLWVLSFDHRFLIFPVGKALFDLALLLPATIVFKQRGLLRFIPFAVFIYPFYLTYAASMAIFTHPEVIAQKWRGGQR